MKYEFEAIDLMQVLVIPSHLTPVALLFLY